MNINSVDLNLFLVFQAIYVARSVTVAGDRIGMTQSAVSNALKRVRERFDDPLFVRTVDGMVPTPLAEQLIGPIEQGIAQFTRAIEQGRRFDPLTSKRLFRLAINDIGQLVMMPRLLAAARDRAPQVRFETIDAPLADARQKMQQGQIDLAVGSWEPLGQAFYQQRLFEETFVVLMRIDNPVGPGELTSESYLEANHVAYRPSGSTDSELQHRLNVAGVLDRRNVVLTAAHSLGLSSIIAASDLLLTAPNRLVQGMVASRSDLRIEPTPFDVRPFEIRQQWHERFHPDSGNRWLRSLFFGLFHQPSKRPGISELPKPPPAGASLNAVTDCAADPLRAVAESAHRIP